LRVHARNLVNKYLPEKIPQEFSKWARTQQLIIHGVASSAYFSIL